MKKLTKNKKKGFTLIELLAVIVVLAILALIAVPIVLNITNKANKQSEERSIESYARALDYAISECMMENPKLKKSEIIVDNYEVKVASTNETCAKVDVSKGTEITGCTYEVSDNEKGYNLIGCQIKDNYYDYIDGKVVEEKEKTYTAYNIGDEITYNGMKFYVIAPSDTKQNYVTLLKETPLTVEEVNTYGGVGTENNHVNMYSTPHTSNSDYQKAYNSNGYGGMAYYSSATCGFPTAVSSWVETGCTTDYKTSKIKHVVDGWSKAKLTQSELKEVNEYKARLLTFDELQNNLGYNQATWNASHYIVNAESTPSWVYNSNYWYWTMSQYENSASDVWYVNGIGYLYDIDVSSGSGVVRPVINLKKSAIK